MCFSYLLLCNKPPQNEIAKQRCIIFMIQWVDSAAGDSPCCVPEVTLLHSIGSLVGAGMSKWPLGSPSTWPFVLQWCSSKIKHSQSPSPHVQVLPPHLLLSCWSKHIPWSRPESWHEYQEVCFIGGYQSNRSPHHVFLQCFVWKDGFTSS